MPDGPARLCLVGCGAIGAVHAGAARRAPERVAYAACYDAHPGAADAFARQHLPDANLPARWEDVLADPDVDAVDLCVPHSLHVPLALAALTAGKHVFLEKPMALSAADCDRLIAAARARRLQLSVMHNRRFAADALAVKALLDAGDLGEPLLVAGRGIEGPDTVGVRSWLAGADEGGVGMAQTVHFAYMLRWLCGPVSQVSCLTSGKGLSEMAGEVTAVFLLRFASGAVGQLASTFAQQAGRNVHRIDLYGGSGQVSFAAGQVDVVSPRRYGDEDWHRETFPADTGGGFVEPLATFGDAALGRGRPAVPPEEGREAVALIEAAYRAAREGRTVDLTPAAPPSLHREGG